MKVNNFRTPLSRFAVKEMYANPGTARQFQLKLTQTSPDVGYIKSFQLMGRYYSTPTAKDFYLVFNMSGFDGSTWNLHELMNRRDPVNKWINVAQVCKDRGMIIDIYGNDGRIFPRDKCWIMSTYDGQHLLAIKKIQSMKHTWQEPCYFHCYTIQTELYDPVSNPLSEEWPRFTSNNGNTVEEKDRMKIVYADYKRRPGLTSIYLNGYLWNDFPTEEEMLGAEVIEITNDPSVYKTESYRVSELEHFFSKRDSTRKFILHPKKVEGDFTYRYVTDVAFYLTDAKGRGVYLYRNRESNFRQLTHCDFAVNCTLVEDMGNSDELIKNEDRSIRLIYRKNDYAQDMQYEAGGVRWLYRMDDQGILGAMIGINSTMQEWRAENLENSETNLYLFRDYMDLTHEQAVKAVGYNRATQVLAGTPISRNPADGYTLDVPYSCRDELTMLEYDEEGLFLRMRKFSKVNQVLPSDDCHLVEFYPGKPGQRIHLEVGTAPVFLEKNSSPRFFYQKVTVGGELSGKRFRAEEGRDYTFDRELGKVTWTLPTSMYTGIVLYNDQTLYKEFTLNHIDNSLSFSVTHEWVNGGLLVGMAPANIIVIMNRRSLIENVDYIVDFPNIYIVNHQYLKEGGNDFVLYCSEWSPLDDTQPLEQSELGYVTGGVIGHNLRYNLREDRVTRTTIDGKVWDPSKVPTAETTAPSELLSPLNGLPYGVKHMYIPLRDWVDYDMTAGWKEARDQDKRMSDYLTLYVRKPEPEVIPTLMDKYRVFSPFMNSVVNQLLLRVIDLDDLEPGESYTDDYVLRKTAAFQWWLKYDPVNLNYDIRYFAVFPYVQQERVAVAPKELIFIQRVNELFLQNRVNVNGHFEVENV